MSDAPAIDTAAMAVFAEQPERKAALPTYQTIADVLEKKNGSGWRLAGWTVARTAMIIPPFLAVGVEWKKALLGSFLSSCLISTFTLVRIYNAGFEEEAKARVLAGRADRIARWSRKSRREP